LGSLTSLFSTGPDAQQMMLEMLADLRRELADFRYEMRLTLAVMREENRSYAQKVLERLGDLEFNLAQRIDAVGEQARWNEYRLLQVEGQIQAMSQQILTRLAELHQKDLVALLTSRDLDRDLFAGLAAGEGSELVRLRYHDALTVTYTAAVHH